MIFLTEFGIEPPVTDVDLSELNSSIILSIYEGTRKQLHVAYNGALNTEPLIGRYMKIDLLSNKLEKAIEKVEKMPDEYFGDVELSEEDIEFMNAGLGPEQEIVNGED